MDSISEPSLIKEGSVGWRFKHELVQNARVAQRESEYYEAQSIREPLTDKKSNTLILARCIAHPEIKGNKQWKVMSECYLCNRWEYTMFLKVNDGKSETIQGSF